MSGDILCCPVWGCGGATVIQRVDAKDTTKQHEMHRANPTAKNHLAGNVNSAAVEKPCSPLRAKQARLQGRSIVRATSIKAATSD